MGKHSQHSSDSLLPWLGNEVEGKVIDRLLPYAVKKHFTKNTYIIMQGNISESIYYLAKGRVKVSTVTSNGKEKTYWYTLAGNIIGDTPFFHQLPTNASIIAADECEIYMFSKPIFENLLAKYPDVYQHITKTMANKIRVLVNQINEMSFCKPKTQICRFLYFFALDFGEDTKLGIAINQHITQSEIASINSLHRITVTKIMNELKTDNIVEYSNKVLTIKDLARLYELAF